MAMLNVGPPERPGGLACTGFQVCHSSRRWPQAKLQHLCHEVRPENHCEGCQLSGNTAQQAGQPDPLVTSGQVSGTWRSQGNFRQCCCCSIPSCALPHCSCWSSVTCIVHLCITSAQSTRYRVFKASFCFDQQVLPDWQFSTVVLKTYVRVCLCVSVCSQ